MLYAIKVARDYKEEDHYREVKQPDFKDMNGTGYECIPGDFVTKENRHEWNLNGQDMFFHFCSSMEPAMKVSPGDNEPLYDRAI
jgi:hypothetical protein